MITSVLSWSYGEHCGEGSLEISASGIVQKVTYLRDREFSFDQQVGAARELDSKPNGLKGVASQFAEDVAKAALALIDQGGGLPFAEPAIFRIHLGEHAPQRSRWHRD